LATVEDPSLYPFVTEWAFGPQELALPGTLDLATVAAFESSAAERRIAGQDLVIDLTDLTFLDSTGMTALVELDRSLKETGASLVLAHPRPHVREVLTTAGLDTVISLVE
jgi:anti-anti-sigma factor